MVLDRINSPADLKGLNARELAQLASEIRQYLVKTVSENGGHLASSLGVVELTIVLHRIFNSPEDKIIWDVGHQCYAHKLLTGRKDSFSTLRQYHGISGFPVREESPHDAFGAGHAGTSVSAALGMALARDMRGLKNHVVAVIGDGSIGAGMALEAINHAGHLGTKIIVVLNDNGMSISPSIGAMARVLNQVRFDPRYESAKSTAKRTITRLPFGESAWTLSKRIKSRSRKRPPAQHLLGAVRLHLPGPGRRAQYHRARGSAKPRPRFRVRADPGTRAHPEGQGPRPGRGRCRQVPRGVPQRAATPPTFLLTAGSSGTPSAG